MTFRALLTFPAVMLLFSIPTALGATTPTSGPADTLDSLSIPKDFTITRIAGPPLVERPIMASFDDRGRLFVSDSAGVNLHGDELVKNPPHRIVVLEDTNHDGVFDTTKLFADKIVFPQGLLWHDGAVFVASPPCLWRLDDTDHDGVCDKRTALITGFPLTGVSDDMHGACLGPDGFIYVCAGRMPHALVDLTGKPLETPGRQPVLVRCRPDGSRAEVVGGTQGNGVEVAWTDEGDAFVSGTFYGGVGKRDALIHFVEGGDYPILDLPITTHQMKSTGDLLPPMVHMAASAPAGFMRYTGRALGDAFHNNLFCTYFNLHAVHRHVLERSGATFRSTDEPFVTSTSIDFHPTDVLEDPTDGSLLIVDTGGWFRIGCPTSTIAKPDIKGGIYRLRRKSLAPSPTTALSPDESRRDQVWTMTRRDGADARSAVRAALNDPSASVRQVAAYSAGLHRDAAAATKLMQLVVTDAPPIQREAANALGRIGNTKAVPALLAAMKGADRFLDHAIIYALIRLADRDATAKGLTDTDNAVKRAALLALDQIPCANLTPQQVAPMLDPIDPALHNAAALVLTRHPEWAAAMLPYLHQALSAASELTPAKRDELRLQLIAFAADPGVQDLIASTLRDAKTPPDIKLLMLETLSQPPLGKLPQTWIAAIAGSLADADERIVRQAVLSVRALPEPPRPVLTRVDPEVNFTALDANQPFPGTELVRNFAVRWTGLLRVPRAGKYTFSTISNDGSRLFLYEKMLVDNGGRHRMTEKSAEIELTAGDHPLRLEFFQNLGPKGCRLLWSASGKSDAIPPDALMHRDPHSAGSPPEPGLLGEYFAYPDGLIDFPDLTAPNFDDALLAVARDANRSPDLRVDALSAAITRLNEVDLPLFDLLVASLDPSKPALLRAAAADAVGRATLDAPQLMRLTEALALAGPLELPKLLPAFARGGDAEVGAALVAALDRAPGAKGLRPAVVEETLAHYPPQVQQSAAPLIARLSATAAQQKARLDELERALSTGDPTRGRAMFFGARAVCSTCHTVENEGGHVGPNLTQIGAVRGQRDLLEAIVYPSATFARTFEPYIVKTRNGVVEAGVISRETADAVYLTTGPRLEKRFERSTIKDLRRSDISIMPQGLDTQLTPQEIADIVAFLNSLK
jgi:putative membrane-bound dehydrogenase-like protein